MPPDIDSNVALSYQARLPKYVDTIIPFWQLLLTEIFAITHAFR